MNEYIRYIQSSDIHILITRSHKAHMPSLLARRVAMALPLITARAMRFGPSVGLHASAALPASRLRGGHAFMMSTATAAEPPATKEKFRADYKPPPYRIDRLSLNFDIFEEETLVTSTLTVRPEAGCGASVPFDLYGEELSLKSIEINGSPLAEGTDYALTEDGLSVINPPHVLGEEFELKTIVSIAPHENTQLSGLYKSGTAHRASNPLHALPQRPLTQCTRPSVVARRYVLLTVRGRGLSAHHVLPGPAGRDGAVRRTHRGR